MKLGIDILNNLWYYIGVDRKGEQVSMKYSYELTYKGGAKAFCIQNHLFTEEKVLNALKQDGVVKVKYHRHIPSGWHLCGCGNLVTHGPDKLLCDECREIYGHTYEDEL